MPESNLPRNPEGCGDKASRRLALQSQTRFISTSQFPFPPLTQRAMKKVLVIDDEEWLREMMQLALRQKGFEVVQAENGSVGVEVARKELPDLILCDVNME